MARFECNPRIPMTSTKQLLGCLLRLLAFLWQIPIHGRPYSGNSTEKKLYRDQLPGRVVHCGRGRRWNLPGNRTRNPFKWDFCVLGDKSTLLTVRNPEKVK